jgi:hypothetical protein
LSSTREYLARLGDWSEFSPLSGAVVDTVLLVVVGPGLGAAEPATWGSLDSVIRLLA